MSEIKVGDKVNAGCRCGTVEKINGDKARVRFQGYKKYCKIEELVLSSEYVQEAKPVKKKSRRWGKVRR